MNLSSKSTHALTRCFSSLQTSGCRVGAVFEFMRVDRQVREKLPATGRFESVFHFPSRTPKRYSPTLAK